MIQCAGARHVALVALHDPDGDIRGGSGGEQVRQTVRETDGQCPAAGNDLHVVDVPARIGQAAVGRPHAPTDENGGLVVGDGRDVKLLKQPRGVTYIDTQVRGPPDHRPVAPVITDLDGGFVEVGVRLDAEPAPEAQIHVGQPETVDGGCGQIGSRKTIGVVAAQVVAVDVVAGVAAGGVSVV